jgi:hypothetical protein
VFPVASVPVAVLDTHQCKTVPVIASRVACVSAADFASSWASLRCVGVLSAIARRVVSDWPIAPAGLLPRPPRPLPWHFLFVFYHPSVRLCTRIRADLDEQVQLPRPDQRLSAAAANQQGEIVPSHATRI